MMWKEIGRTARAALKGWAQTLRLVVLMAAATALGTVWVMFSR